MLRPYIEGGSKFFIAKIDPKKVRFENGQGEPLPGGAGFTGKPRTCGCQADSPGALAGGALLAGVSLLLVRRRWR